MARQAESFGRLGSLRGRKPRPLDPAVARWTLVKTTSDGVETPLTAAHTDLEFLEGLMLRLRHWADLAGDRDVRYSIRHR